MMRLLPSSLTKVSSMHFLGQKKSHTITLLILSALLSTAGQAATCKKLNAMQGQWDVQLDVPLTLNRTTFDETYSLPESTATITNFARLSLHGQFTFNNKSILTKANFRDHQFDHANLLGVLEYSKSPRGIRLDRTTRYTNSNQKVTNWKKANGRCHGNATFMLRGLDKVDGNNLLIPASTCMVRYRLNGNAQNANLDGICDVLIYDPQARKRVLTVGVLSGSMIKKF